MTTRLASPSYLAKRAVAVIEGAMANGGILRRARWMAAWIEAVSALAFARVLVRFVPFRLWRATVGPINTIDDIAARPPVDPVTLRRAKSIGRHIRRTAAKMPFEAVCLPQAMAARWMLKRRNIATQMYFGARRGWEGKPFDLHAWLMFGDTCLTGQDELESYAKFSKQ